MCIRRTHITGGHVVVEVMFFPISCAMGGHVLQDDMSYGRTCLVESHIV